VSTVLLDSSVLIALTIAEHEHHASASAWLAEAGRFAVCPVVEGALVRFLVRLGESGETARAVLEGVHRHARCAFWPDSLSYRGLGLAGVRGHRQVTDAYLVGLAEHRRGRLATLDRALVEAHPRRTVLVA
jgi:toxin-antitoxin system PIN domain toxin